LFYDDIVHEFGEITQNNGHYADGRAIAYSEREREFTFAKTNVQCCWESYCLNKVATHTFIHIMGKIPLLNFSYDVSKKNVVMQV